jgi:lysophospholipase L1-like esterase
MSEHKVPGLTRREILQGATVAFGIGAVIPVRADSSTPTQNRLPLEDGDTILFQGDSITDAGRDRMRETEANQADALGHGYPLLLAYELLRDHPDKALTVYNRGVSGNTVPDLAARWQRDCVDLRPGVLSILVGVNDIWHKLDGDFDGTVESYRRDFAALLESTREALPDVRIVVCEPFALRTGAVDGRWFPEFDERRRVARAVADEAGARWVAFQSLFDDAAAGTAPAYWAADGVHPTMAGHSLMARAWRQATGI